MAMYLKRLFQEQGLDFAVLGCYLNLANPDKEQLKKITETYIAHLRSLLGCGVVGTETGCPNMEYRNDPASRTEEAYQTFVTNLHPVVEAAEKLGALIAIEPVRYHIIFNSKRVRRLLDEVNSPNLQIILDPVNLLAMDNYEQQTYVPEEAIELLGKETAVAAITAVMISSRRSSGTTIFTLTHI
jgi:sugar phosphate isomerase/epimerase